MKKSNKNKKSYFGRKAQRTGKNFETFIEQSLRLSGFSVINLPEAGVKWINTKKTIHKKISCDFIAGKDRKTLLIDAKKISGKKFTYSYANKRPHQIKDLFRFKKEGGCFESGFVVLFEGTGNIHFFNAEKLWELEENQSLTDGVFLGNYESIQLKWDKLLETNK